MRRIEKEKPPATARAARQRRAGCIIHTERSISHCSGSCTSLIGGSPWPPRPGLRAARVRRVPVDGPDHSASRLLYDHPSVDPQRFEPARQLGDVSPVGEADEALVVCTITGRLVGFTASCAPSVLSASARPSCRRSLTRPRSCGRCARLRGPRLCPLPAGFGRVLRLHVLDIDNAGPVGAAVDGRRVLGFHRELASGLKVVALEREDKPRKLRPRDSPVARDVDNRVHCVARTSTRAREGVRRCESRRSARRGLPRHTWTQLAQINRGEVLLTQIQETAATLLRSSPPLRRGRSLEHVAQHRDLLPGDKLGAPVSDLEENFLHQSAALLLLFDLGRGLVERDRDDADEDRGEKHCDVRRAGKVEAERIVGVSTSMRSQKSPIDAREALSLPPRVTTTEQYATATQPNPLLAAQSFVMSGYMVTPSSYNSSSGASPLGTFCQYPYSHPSMLIRKIPSQSSKVSILQTVIIATASEPKCCGSLRAKRSTPITVKM